MTLNKQITESQIQDKLFNVEWDLLNHLDELNKVVKTVISGTIHKVKSKDFQELGELSRIIDSKTEIRYNLIGAMMCLDYDFEGDGEE